jgi:hypothetical protein
MFLAKGVLFFTRRKRYKALSEIFFAKNTGIDMKF